MNEDLYHHDVRGVHLFGHGFLSNCDYNSNETLEITLHSILDDYMTNGVECFNKLDGSYFVILWDGIKEKLYINRDTYGTKLLYYYYSKENGLIFSNNLNIILKLIGQKNISQKALHEYLRFLDISPPYTVYENIYFLNPEDILIVDKDTLMSKNISASLPIKQGNIKPLEETEGDLKKLLFESIDRRIKKAKKVGVFLSGGIDSTIVCTLASKLTNNIKAYTVGFSDPKYDESNVAQDITHYLDIDHEILKFTFDQDYAVFNEFVSRNPSPFADPAVIPTYQSFKYINDSQDVILDGTGADSLIGIMPARHVRFVLRYSRRLPYSMRLWLSDQIKKLTWLSRYSEVFDYKNAVELLIRWQGWTEQEISTLCNTECDLSDTRFYKLFAQNINKGSYELYSKLIGALPDDRIHQIAALFNLDVKFPFFNKNVQEFVAALPLQYKYNNGIS
ncbi:MAG: asparagine synthase-related protein, partial [Planctomycetota bacterium]